MIHKFRREMRVEQGKLEIFASKVGRRNILKAQEKLRKNDSLSARFWRKAQSAAEFSPEY